MRGCGCMCAYGNACIPNFLRAETGLLPITYSPFLVIYYVPRKNPISSSANTRKKFLVLANSGFLQPRIHFAECTAENCIQVCHNVLASSRVTLCKYEIWLGNTVNNKRKNN